MDTRVRDIATEDGIIKVRSLGRKLDMKDGVLMSVHM